MYSNATNYIPTNRRIFDNPQTLAPKNKNDSTVITVNTGIKQRNFHQCLMTHDT